MPVTDLPRICEVRRRVVHEDERLLDFSPVRLLVEGGETQPLYLFLTDRRLLAVHPDQLDDTPEQAVLESPREDAAFVMLSADTLRLLIPDGPINCRFPSPAVATAFRRGLLK